MRIKMLKDYRGPLGRFAKGKPYDLNPHIVKQLPEDYFQEIAADGPNKRKARHTDGGQAAAGKAGKQSPKSD